MAVSIPRIPREQVKRLWFERQGLSAPRGTVNLDRKTFVAHLEQTGGLQIDTINVVERAHYLTLWSRFGVYDRPELDSWIYKERLAYEYRGHEACILPMSHYPIGARRMRRYPTALTKSRSWWPTYSTSAASKKFVLKQIRTLGPQESTDFEKTARSKDDTDRSGGVMYLPGETSRSLKLLCESGKLAVSGRRHFRCVYDLAENVYPDIDPVSPQEYEDSWLFIGLSGNGAATEKHLQNYITAPNPDAATRKRILNRNLKRGAIVEVTVEGSDETWYMLPEHLERVAECPPPIGTTLLCPFDSFLWQRKRAEELCGFFYRIEIYVPKKKREFGYYALPILHDGKLVGRLDPKLHRKEKTLEIIRVGWESGYASDTAIKHAVSAAVEDLASFCEARQIDWPVSW